MTGEADFATVVSIAMVVCIVAAGLAFGFVIEPSLQMRDAARRRLVSLRSITSARGFSADRSVFARKSKLSRFLPTLVAIEERAGHGYEIAGGVRLFRVACLFGLGILVLVFLVAEMLFDTPVLLAAALSVVAGYFSGKYLMNAVLRHTQVKILKQFSPALDMIIRGVNAGIPAQNSIRLAAEEIPDPLARELTRMINRQEIGVPYEEALAETAERIGLPEFDMLLITLKLQRQTGGSLTEALENLSAVVRQRFEIELKVKAITSEARLSSLILIALPFGIGGTLLFFSPDNWTFFTQDETGKAVALAILGMIGFGWFLIRSLVRSVKL